MRYLLFILVLSTFSISGTLSSTQMNINNTDYQDTIRLKFELTDANIIYTGIDNIVHISETVSNNYYRISATGVSITRIGNGTFKVKGTIPLKGFIRVQIGENMVTFPVVVKNLPNPRIQLGELSSSNVNVTDFTKQETIVALVSLQDVEQRIICSVNSFEITRITKSGEQVTVKNNGEYFTNETITLIQKATAGDIYLIENVNCECPADRKPRNKIDGVIYRIK